MKKYKTEAHPRIWGGGVPYAQWTRVCAPTETEPHTLDGALVVEQVVVAGAFHNPTPSRLAAVNFAT